MNRSHHKPKHDGSKDIAEQDVLMERDGMAKAKAEKDRHLTDQHQYHLSPLTVKTVKRRPVDALKKKKIRKTRINESEVEGRDGI